MEEKEKEREEEVEEMEEEGKKDRKGKKNVKEFICDQCDAPPFTCRQHLYPHKLLHVGPSYQCQKCKKLEKKTLWPLFLWMEFNCLKAIATKITFYH